MLSPPHVEQGVTTGSLTRSGLTGCYRDPEGSRTAAPLNWEGNEQARTACFMHFRWECLVIIVSQKAPQEVSLPHPQNKIIFPNWNRVHETYSMFNTFKMFWNEKSCSQFAGTEKTHTHRKGKLPIGDPGLNRGGVAAEAATACTPAVTTPLVGVSAFPYWAEPMRVTWGGQCLGREVSPSGGWQRVVVWGFWAWGQAPGCPRECHTAQNELCDHMGTIPKKHPKIFESTQ